YERQTRWENEYDAFNHWRAAVESVGAVVFQVRDVSTKEMRGFSLNGTTPFPAIALNISDPVRARIFTLAHESTHLALRDAGLCDLEDEQSRPPEELATEIFCNHAAGAAMIPRDYLLAEPEVRSQQGLASWSDATIEALATRYRASREVVVRRLLVLGRATSDFYKRKRSQFGAEYLKFLATQKAKAAEKGTSGFAPPATVALSTAGQLFTRLVLDGYEREIITSSDVADYLDIRLKHLPKIERAIARSG
ncbi:MAG: ImmA/IrrE family metallo-endopeptidase, partial [Candidatus Rokubacteria bacterium]|nr:ImmA/IrrE family metallo-endopeptidase [Candidatus Rokubacteria bacterium]